jgi:hypothetical protein
MAKWSLIQPPIRCRKSSPIEAVEDIAQMFAGSDDQVSHLPDTAENERVGPRHYVAHEEPPQRYIYGFYLMELYLWSFRTTAIGPDVVPEFRSSRTAETPEGRTPPNAMVGAGNAAGSSSDSPRAILAQTPNRTYRRADGRSQHVEAVGDFG